MRTIKVYLKAFLIMLSLVLGRELFAGTAKTTKTLPVATYDSVSYGSHPRQVMDVYLPKTNAAAPVVVFIHGGGFTSGDRKDGRLAYRIPKCLADGIAMIAVEYRFLKDCGDAKPPVKACLDDVISAIRFIRTKSSEWKLDTNRIGLTGSSAGGCACLFAALTCDNIFGIKAVFAQYPQTSLDPEEMREWIPNSKYGANLFGYPDFQTWLDKREEVLPWIERFSPAELLRKCTPSKAPAFFYSGPNAPLPGQLDKDPTHSGTFNDKFKAIAQERGIVCRRGSHDDMVNVLKSVR